MHYPHASSVPPPRTTWHWSASMVRRNLPTVALGTSLDVAVGTSVVAVGSGLGLQAGTGGTLSTSGPPGSFTAYIQVPVTNKAGGRVVVAGPDRSGLRCGDCQHGRPLCRLRRPRPSWRQEHTDQQLQGHAWGHGERQGKNRVRDLRGGSDPGRHPHCHDAGLAIPWVLLRT